MRKLPNKKIVWVILPLLVLLGIVTYFKKPSSILHTTNNNTLSHNVACENPAAEHKTIILRSGIITKLEVEKFTMSFNAQPEENFSSVDVTLTSEPELIEIRVPSYMSPTRREALKNGGIVIERVPVPLSNLYLGMKIDVLSETDMFCQTTVMPFRLEYEIVINTENDS